MRRTRPKHAAAIFSIRYLSFLFNSFSEPLVRSRAEPVPKPRAHGSTLRPQQPSLLRASSPSSLIGAAFGHLAVGQTN